jgi:hypothetical protein
MEEDPHWQLSSSSLRLPTLAFGVDLERKLTQDVHMHLVNHSQGEIGVAAFGAGTWSSSQPRQSEDAGSRISELVFSNDSLKHILPWQPLPTTPRLRSGAHGDRFREPRGDNTPINIWLW